MKTQILICEKKLRPTLRNIFRAVALENECLIEFRFAKGKSCLKYQDVEISEISLDNTIYSLDNLISDAKELLDSGRAVDNDFAVKLLLFFYNSLEVAEVSRIVNILNFVITKVSLYSYDEVPVDKELATFYIKWSNAYNGLKTFDLTEKALINNVNGQETEEYKRAFAEMNKSGIAPSIQSAIASLLDSIPEDVEKLLDIGSGPGYMDEAIPKDIQVLAMDIDEKILETNPRKYCLGDVLQIPLKNKSVDMTITCDMLEHIEPEQLNKACEEIKRVTKKYIYIQVPYMENLDAGKAYCEKCGKEWHVNFHKSNFDEKKIFRLIGEEWKPIFVNHTGEYAFDSSLQSEFLFAKNNSLKCNLISGWKCPFCGSISVPRNEKLIDSLHRLFKIETGYFPRYSEIGILFINNAFKDEFDFPAETKYVKKLMRKNEVDFYDAHEVTKEVNIYACCPTVYSSDKWEKTESGIKFYKTTGREWGEFGCCFPLYFKEGDFLEIKGCAKIDGEIIISSTTLGKREIRMDAVKIPAGMVEIRIPCPIYILGNKALVKFYFSMEEMEINLIRVKRKGVLSYVRYEFKENTDFFRIKKGNLLINYYVHGRAYLDVSEDGNHGDDFGCLLRGMCQNEEIIEELQFELAKVGETLKVRKKEETEVLLDEDMSILLEQMNIYAVDKACTELEVGEELAFAEEINQRIKAEAEEEEIFQSLLTQDLMFSFYEETKTKSEGKYWIKRKMDVFIALVYEKPLLYNLVIKSGIRNICVRIINWKRGKK